MEKKVGLKRLLDPERLTTLLEQFEALLGAGASLSVSDEPPLATEHDAAAPILLDGRPIGWVVLRASSPMPAQTQAVLAALRCTLEALAVVTLERRAVAHEALERYRELSLLYSLGETLSTCMDVDELLRLTLSRAGQMIHAPQSAILLYDEAGGLTLSTHAGLTDEFHAALIAEQGLWEEVARAGKSRFLHLREANLSLLAVPMRTSERQLGIILLAGKEFTAGDEKLLSALAWQAAIALENARLFDNVRRRRDEIAVMKQRTDNILASIASGVITTDAADIITTFNPAAEAIFRTPAAQVLQRPYRQALGFLQHTPFPSLIEEVRQRRKSSVVQEISARLPHGEQIHLNLSLSLLQGEDETAGVVTVVNDVTEKRRYERERALLRHYLPAGLVDWLPKSDEADLHHDRRVITALFGDIRGFTSFSEVNPPERVLEVLNHYLTLCEAAVRFNWGIVDKYMGDAVLALFNTPLLEQKEHAWRAVRMAWLLKEAIAAYHQYVPPDERLDMGFGICTGVVVVGNVGAAERIEYTAIGDTVNLARRLQQMAQGGQILISHETWEAVRHRVQADPLPAMRVKGRQSFARVYAVTGIDDRW